MNEPKQICLTIPDNLDTETSTMYLLIQVMEEKFSGGGNLSAKATRRVAKWFNDKYEEPNTK